MGESNLSDERKVLIYWIAEKKTSIENIDLLQEEDRYPGRITRVTWAGDNKCYIARVIAVSENMEELDQAENEFAKQIEKELLHDSGPQSKRKRKPNAKFSKDQANDKQISVALGEKPKLTHSQVQSKKHSQNKTKGLKICQKSAQAKLDAALTSVNRNLFSSTVTESQNHPRDENQNEVKGTVDNISSEVFQKDIHSTVADLESTHTSDEKSAQTGDVGNLSLCYCQEIRENANPSTRKFVALLGKIMENPGTPNSLSATSSNQNSNYLQPLPLHPSTKKVELTHGSGLYIDIKRKNEIKANCCNNPEKMLREVLTEIFGRKLFLDGVHITARGSKTGTKGFEDNVLQAILAFINRNCPPEMKLKLSEMNRLINKKACDWRRYYKNFHDSSSSAALSIVPKSPIKPAKNETTGSAVLEFTNASGRWMASPKKNDGGTVRGEDQSSASGALSPSLVESSELLVETYNQAQTQTAAAGKPNIQTESVQPSGPLMDTCNQVQTQTAAAGKPRMETGSVEPNVPVSLQTQHVSAPNSFFASSAVPPPAHGWGNSAPSFEWGNSNYYPPQPPMPYYYPQYPHPGAYHQQPYSHPSYHNTHIDGQATVQEPQGQQVDMGNYFRS